MRVNSKMETHSKSHNAPHTDVSGHQHRIALGNYVEVHQVNGLTLSQPPQLDVVPCPVCEQRLVRAHMPQCHHCTSHARQQQRQSQGILLMLACLILLAAGYSLSGLLGIPPAHHQLAATLLALLAGSILYGLYLAIHRWLRQPVPCSHAATCRQLILAYTLATLGMGGLALAPAWPGLGGFVLMLLALRLLR